MNMAVRFLRTALLSGALACMASLVRAQDMEPRAYSASPIGTNFLVASYLRTTGSDSVDASLPITDVKGSINTAVLGYERTFDLLGRTASLALAIPYFDAGFSGAVEEKSTEITRKGHRRCTIAFRHQPHRRPGPAAGRIRLAPTFDHAWCKLHCDCPHRRL
jgi:hypothetical protein